MKRALLVAVVALVALTSACSSEQRPEGITERWLLSLNQGAAGQPDRYAPDEVSEQVVPGWHDLDPGFLDVITVEPKSLAVGRAVPGAFVPFRLVDERRGRDRWHSRISCQTATPGGSRRVSIRRGTTPTEGGSPFGAGLPGWPIALAVGALLALAALGLLTIVRRRATTRPETRKSRPEGRPVRCSQVHGEGARVGDQLPSPRGMGFGCPGVVTLPIEGTGRDIREIREKVPKKRAQ